MRRLILEEPYARSAVWTRRLALLGAAVALTGLLLAQRAGADPRMTLVVFGAAVVLACLALLASVVAAVVIWRSGRRGAGRTLGGVLLAGLVIGYPGYLAARMVREPGQHDVSTDPADPPRFSLSSRSYLARGQRLDTLATPAPGDRRGAEPIAPAVLDLTPGDAFGIVLKVAAALRWRVIETIPPGGRSGLGHLDAVTTATALRLPEDIAIRVTPLAGQTRVDVRSKSRFDLPDLGSNARNVHDFLDGLEDATDGS